MDIKKVAIIGTGSMGGMMGMLFAEHGCQVSLYDPSTKASETAAQHAKDAGFGEQVKSYKDYGSLCRSLGSPKVFLLSIPHGNVGDGILDSLDPYLVKGDIIVDAANEHYLNCQRRQGRAQNRGVHYIGAGVSGGYQAARSGPSLSPGGDEVGLDKIMPLLEKVAAKDVNGTPCVAKMGPGGSGHYVKMIHNGIEQGLMVALGESWAIMHQGLGMSYDEIADEFEKWNSDGELKENFLVSIGVDICRTLDPRTKKPMLDLIKDKVAQDVDGSEGTGVWTCEEGMKLHTPIPTIAAAHTFRLASADATIRAANFEAAGGAALSTPSKMDIADRKKFLEDIRLATYGAFLAAFVQGLKLLAKADSTNHWGIDFSKVIGIWRGGCIIRSEAISEFFLEVYKEAKGTVIEDTLSSPLVAKEFQRIFPSLKKVVMKALETDAIAPTLNATLEYLKYSTEKEGLPTDFVEAELDYFGAHMFDLKEGPAGEPITGAYHFGWKAAKDVPERHEIVKGKP